MYIVYASTNLYCYSKYMRTTTGTYTYMFSLSFCCLTCYIFGEKNKWKISSIYTRNLKMLPQHTTSSIVNFMSEHIWSWRRVSSWMKRTVTNCVYVCILYKSKPVSVCGETYSTATLRQMTDMNKRFDLFPHFHSISMHIVSDKFFLFEQSASGLRFR